MKITRSQLKKLIKEEMNRVNEEDTVAGDAVEGAYPFEGMTVHQIANVLAKFVKGRGADGGLEIEGLDSLRNLRNSVKRRAAAASSSDNPLPGLGVTIHVNHHEPVTSSDGSYTDNTDRTAWASASLDDATRTGAELKDAVAKFNAQNDGKGGQVKHGGNEHFQWTSSDNVTPDPTQGPHAAL